MILNESSSTDVVTIFLIKVKSHSNKNSTPEQADTSEQDNMTEREGMAEGEDTREHKFMVHKTPLCSKSAYFEKAFNGHFIETATQTLVLEDVNIPSFQLFLNWIYAGVIIEGVMERDLETLGPLVHL